MLDRQVQALVRDAGFLDEWDGLWRRHDANSFFRSPAHLRMIARLTGAEIVFAVASRQGLPVAALPAAILAGPHGPVVNSLPYYGTCSAVVGETGGEMAQLLADSLIRRGQEIGAASVTFVDDWRAKTFVELQGANFVSHRTNQFIDLGGLRGSDPMDSYHQKTRNLVRKAGKLGLAIRLSEASRDIDGLAAAHRENMLGVNGIAKPEDFFDLLRDPARPLGMHRLYVASIGGRDCGFLLNFYCGDTVEYYMPSVYVADRNLQPLSLLIHTAIQDAVADGFSYWNFGGTWPTQDSLRHFKIRWGSKEATYNYFTYVLDDEVLEKTSEDLLSAYPYFFVAPFERLGQRSSREFQ